jgi:hypothetical protein
LDWRLCACGFRVIRGRAADVAVGAAWVEVAVAA